MSDEQSAILQPIRSFSLQGGGREISLSESAEAKPAWVLLDRGAPEAQHWLARESGLPEPVVGGLLSEETRPRFEGHEGGILLILRGVNLNPGADPEDMISVRMWVEEERLIALRGRRIMALADHYEALEKGEGPTRIGGLLSGIILRLLVRMEPVITELEESCDDLEIDVLESQAPDLRQPLYALRHKLISLRRYIAPQRDALKQLLEANPVHFNKEDRQRLRDAIDRVTRYVEALDATRDRTTVIQDELGNRLAESANSRIYLMSIVAGIFLPLGLVTGLLGINVGGMPGVDDGEAFWIVCGLLGVLLVFELWLFRRMKWL
ncbi:zinc transporter ZntB [Limibacillus halophilus]